ncbi:methyltransferase domain-containing protein [Ramlibacter algicola]|uniref:Tetratricopeptide repeat protein n=1 Tax=Ramlibacter algicola TaxID=2795217 RepID=A0A934PXK9_9BURK|nr:methyltransferase domain-containing protein [Ramlibacter algicola]MBK0390993.1 tetratricopeptide repeat protein [Ramlibacter algicola]
MDAATFEQAKAQFLRGVQAFEAGRYEDAERAFADSVRLLPGRASSLMNLGATRIRLGQHARAVEALQAAIAAEPANAEAHGHLATALAELGRPDEALEAAGTSLRLDPEVGSVWLLQAHLLRERGDVEQAAVSYREAAARGADPQLVHYALAGLGAEPAPATSPRQYVEQLFDSYAAGFDEHLVDTLQYRAPAVLAEGLARPRYHHALDLGCGTGLAAPVLRPRCERLDAIDLSPGMVECVRALGTYDAVVQGDIADHLAGVAGRYDLLLAADVLIYIGDLAPVVAGAARALQPGGEFCFTVEVHDGPGDWVLRPSLRYAHGEGYIRMLAGQHGFSVRRTARHPLRLDQGHPVEGLFTWLERPSHAA